MEKTRMTPPSQLKQVMLESLFYEARTIDQWDSRTIPLKTLEELYKVVSLGPTSGNCSPARFVFLLSNNSRERLKLCLSPGNIAKTITAPVNVIVAYDLLFFEKFPYLNPEPNLKSWFEADPNLSDETAFRNGTLQGGFMIIAARALGLSVGAISGFDNQKVDELFLAKQGWRSNFILNLGFPPPEYVNSPRLPRLDFQEACIVL